MAREASNRVAREICPHLGLASDPSTSCPFVTDSHRCYRWPTPVSIGEGHQITFCLSGDYGDCLRPSDTEGRVPPWGRRASLGGGHRKLVGAVAVISLLALAFVFPRDRSLVASIFAGTGGGTGPGAGQPAAASSRLAGGSPTSAILAAPTATLPPVVAGPSSTATPSPTATKPVAVTTSPGRPAVPTAVTPPAVARTATVAPSPVRPTATPGAQLILVTSVPAPTGAPANYQVYVVQAGDTLWSVARTFGVSVDEIAKANNLQDTTSLRAGQQLLIPR